MLFVVHVRLGAVVAPGLRAFDRGLHHFGRALGADQVIRDINRASAHLPALGEQLDAVGIFVNDREMIEDVAPLLFDANLPTAQPSGPHGGLVFHGPGGFVQAVNVLLDVEVAR